MLQQTPSAAEAVDAGRTVQAGRHRLRVTVAGTGAPAVVFEPGLGGSAADWAAIQAAVAGAGFAAIAYDRAGHGRSSPARDARRSDQIADDLHALLCQVAVPPFVLVGHSLGGVHVRAFAWRFPEAVAGLVLVESSHPRQPQPPLPAGIARLRIAVRNALLRLAPARSIGRHDARSYLRELRAFQQVAGQADVLAPGALGEKPLVVLTAAPPGEPVEQEGWEAWQALHADLARLSANSRQHVAAHGGHDLHRDAPALVVDAILAVCRAARDGTPLAFG